MQITSSSDIGIIQTAKSDCGRIDYYPIADDRIVINGRDAYRGDYVGGGEVERDLWLLACDLMTTVDDHNRQALNDAREEHFAARQSEADAVEKALTGWRGTYADPNTH